MKKIKMIIIALVFSAPGYAQEKQEPLKSMSTCLIMYDWTSWGMWRFDVYALAGNMILIGEKKNHFRIDSSNPGYSHVIDGEVVATYPDATSIDDLGENCQDNCPVNHERRTGWFKRRCDSYPS